MSDDLSGLRLAHPGQVQVEYVGNSGMLDVGGARLYVFDEDHDICAMLVRVLAKHPVGTDDITVGSVYVCKVFRDQGFDWDGERYRIMYARHLEAELEGYDDAAQAVADELDAERYPVCGKA